MDDNEPTKRPAYQIGQDISLMSTQELQETVDLMKAEIARLEVEIASKSASRNAAEAFFKR